MGIRIAQGSITDFKRSGKTQAIVNAANVAGLGGGGVDGAIHKAAGPGLRFYIERHYPVLYADVRIPVAGNIVTEALGDLAGGKIIHAVGPVFPSGYHARQAFDGEKMAIDDRNYDPERLLYECLRNVLITAKREQIEALAVPAISCGVFGCSFPIFARCLYRAMAEINLGQMEVVVVLFTNNKKDAFTKAWKEIESRVTNVPLNDGTEDYEG